MFKQETKIHPHMFKQETTFSQTLPNCGKGKIYTHIKNVFCLV